MTRELALAEYRRLTQVATLASVTLLTVGLYLMITGRGVGAGVVLAVGSVGILYAATRFTIRPEAASQNVLVLVGKRNCPLCEEAKQRLKGMAYAAPFEVQQVLIEEHPRLRRRYKEWVPVVLWQNEELAKGDIDWDALEAKLGRIQQRITAGGSKSYQQAGT